MNILRRLYSRRATLPRATLQVNPVKMDPGISRQRKLIQEGPSEIDELDFDELESDFMNVHKSQKEHIRELEAWKEKEKYLIVRQKYFKEKCPNFLTWHDKEQMRFLYRTNQEEWSIQRLSEGFPALPNVIKEIVTSKWTKKNKTKISNHDNAVLQNWNDFKQGKMNHLPNDLKEHLQKFSKRTLNFGPFQELDAKQVMPQTISKYDGEFSEIIKSYERLKNPNISAKSDGRTVDQTNNAGQKLDTTSGTKNTKGDLMTFKEMQRSIEEKILKNADVSLQDPLLQNTQLPKTETNIMKTNHQDLQIIIEHRHETNKNKVGLVRKTGRDVSHLVYPEKITIPDGIYKKGCTYKLNDCFYDSDGEFLYRVPGMS